MRLALHDPSVLPVAVTLSELRPHWQLRRNRFGHLPAAEFGLTEPFQLLPPPLAAELRECCTRHYDGPYEFRTARTSGCLRGCTELEALWGERSFRSSLEALASRLANTQLMMHTMALERAHVNVQKVSQVQPVDEWHEDSMPFVLVTVLTEHTHDPGGALLVSRETAQGEVPPLSWKLRTPGQAVLMQGAHLVHCAQQSMTGERLTVVTSFVPASPLVVDTSSPRIAVLYSPPGVALVQFTAHMRWRLRRDASQALVQVQRRKQGDTQGDGELPERLRVLGVHAAKLVQDCNELSRILTLEQGRQYDAAKQTRQSARSLDLGVERAALSELRRFADAVETAAGAVPLAELLQDAAAVKKLELACAGIVGAASATNSAWPPDHTPRL